MRDSKEHVRRIAWHSTTSALHAVYSALGDRRWLSVKATEHLIQARDELISAQSELAP